MSRENLILTALVGRCHDQGDKHTVLPNALSQADDVFTPVWVAVNRYTNWVSDQLAGIGPERGRQCLVVLFRSSDQSADRCMEHIGTSLSGKVAHILRGRWTAALGWCEAARAHPGGAVQQGRPG